MVHTTHAGKVHLKLPDGVMWKPVPLSLIGYLLHKAILQRAGDTALHIIHRNKYRNEAKIWRQRNILQMKEQNKTPVKELNKMQISNVTDIEFKTLVILMLSFLCEKFNKEIGNIKQNQSEMKDKLTKMKNTLQGINSGLDDAENQICN